MKRFLSILSMLFLLIFTGCTTDKVYTIGGVAEGVHGEVVLQNIGIDELTVSSDGEFTFGIPLVKGLEYNVTILSQPTTQSCSLENATGVVSEDNVTDIILTCADNEVLPNQSPTANAGADQTITVGESVTLDGSASADPDGSIASYAWKEGATVLSTAVSFSKADFGVGVHILTLTVTDDDGATGSDDVNVTVNALPNQSPTADAGADQTITVGESVTLDGSASADPDGSIASYAWKEGATILSTAVSFSKADFGVGVHTLTLTVTDDDGATGSDDVNVTVNALSTYTVGGSAEGVCGDVVLQNNGGNNLTVNDNGTFTFTTTIPDGSDYHVTILSKSATQTCTLSHNTGTVSGANVTDVNLSCSDLPTYAIGGTISGLSVGSSVTLSNTHNGITSTQSVSGTSYTLSEALLDGTEYSIEVTLQPTTQSCDIENASGTISGANVTNVNITCEDIPTGSVSARIRYLNGTITLRTVTTYNGSSDISDEDITGTGDNEFITEELANSLYNGTEYNITIETQPDGQVCLLGARHKGTITAGVPNPIAAISCKDITVPPSTDPFIIGVIPQATGSEYIFQIVTYTHDYPYLYNVDCDGDGTNEAEGITGNYTCVYDDMSERNISILGTFPKLQDGRYISSVEHWGDQHWLDVTYMFNGNSSLVINATDTPDLSHIESMMGMFRGATLFNSSINNWNVSSVTNMQSMFNGARYFNQPLNDWNVSSVTNMQSMFDGAQAFNQPLNSWAEDIKNVTNMVRMFAATRAFDQPLNQWNVSSVTNMNRMFLKAEVFNQPLNDWNVSSVEEFSEMFHGTKAFNQPLNDWNVSSAVSMAKMFCKSEKFNQPLNDWDVSSVTNMYGMFQDSKAFNASLHGWDVRHVTGNVWSGMYYMFSGAKAFNNDVGEWNVSNVVNMDHMFASDFYTNEAVFNHPSINTWTIGKSGNGLKMNDMFHGNSYFNQSLDTWDTDRVSTMDRMFNDASNFEQNLSGWNVNNVGDHHSNFADGSSIIEEPHWVTP